MSESDQKPSGAAGWLRQFVANLLHGRENGPEEEDSREGYFDAAARALDIGERAILLNLVRFGDLRVQDVMVQRAEITGVEVETPLEELAEIFAEGAHSRLPIYRGSLDEPLGMVHIKDVLRMMVRLDAPAEPVLDALKREVLFVPSSMRAIDLLAKMQKTSIHMALVIDEFGGTDGLVTIEDIVEQIVGDIEDEHDSEDPELVTRLADGTYEANARVSINDFNQTLNVLFKMPDSSEGADTLAGLLFSLVGHVPQKGEVIVHPSGVKFEILEADPRHVQTVRVDTTALDQRVEKIVTEAHMHDPT